MFKLNATLLKSQRVNERKTGKTFLIHFFHAISLFLMGAVITVLLTEIGKRWIGRLRPHFMSVCKPDYSTFNCTTAGLTGEFYNPIYTGDSFCTGDANEIKEARFSVCNFSYDLIISKLVKFDTKYHGK